MKEQAMYKYYQWAGLIFVVKTIGNDQSMQCITKEQFDSITSELGMNFLINKVNGSTSR